MAGTGAPKGMIFLDPRNKIITEFLEKKFEDPATKEVSDQAFSEFDGKIDAFSCVLPWERVSPWEVFTRGFDENRFVSDFGPLNRLTAVRIRLERHRSQALSFHCSPFLLAHPHGCILAYVTILIHVLCRCDVPAANGGERRVLVCVRPLLGLPVAVRPCSA